MLVSNLGKLSSLRREVASWKTGLGREMEKEHGIHTARGSPGVKLPPRVRLWGVDHPRAICASKLVSAGEQAQREGLWKEKDFGITLTNHQQFSA